MDEEAQVLPVSRAFDRANGMKPSMAASIEVVAVCRRAMKWDEADECYA